MRIYINKLRIFFLIAILLLSLISLTFMQINLKNDSIGSNESEIRVTNTKFIKVPLALSLLWSNSNAIRADYGNDYARNDDIIADNDVDQQYDDYDQYYREQTNVNEIFKEGDFDPLNNTQTTHKFQSPIKVIITRSLIPNKVITEEDLYWSQSIEKSMDKGLSDNSVENFLNKIKVKKVVRVESPTWNKCGRAKNQFVEFEDGTQVCARYRFPHQYLIFGELMSFYLSRLLGINNVPTVTLVNTSDHIWSDVWNQSLAQEWRPNTSVALIQWIDSLRRDRMPSLILNALFENTTLRANSLLLQNSSTQQLVELMQWSDLLIFDYITGNYDRVSSMQDAAIKENNTTILKETIHNLVKSKRTNSIWMIDNESGLLDGYWLMYSRKNGNESSLFVNFHRAMLKTNCIFRRSTIEHLRLLHSHRNANKLLIDFVSQYEPSFKRQLFQIKPDYFRFFSQHFQQRIGQVFTHYENCKVNR